MTATVNITRVSTGNIIDTNDELAAEEPLQIQVLHGPSGEEQIKTMAITMRTPGNDDELAAGFLFTEGMVQKRSQLTSIVIEPSGPNTVLAVFDSAHKIPSLVSERNFYISSSCGVCGKSSIDALKQEKVFSSSADHLLIKKDILHQLPSTLRSSQQTFRTTGGIHACALFNTKGELLMLREDVGRHNALDKLIGSMFLGNQLPLHNCILLLSGRASFELVQKAAMAGVEMIAAIGAPSSLAVEMAVENHITLVGFLKEDRFNIYSSAERIDQA